MNISSTLFCTVALIYISFQSFAQSTWNRYLSFNVNSYYCVNDSTAGPKDITQLADGKILILAHMGVNGDDRIFTFDTAGNYISEIPAGAEDCLGLTDNWSNYIFPTPDSGFVLTGAHHSHATTYFTVGSVFKYNKNLQQQWQLYFTPENGMVHEAGKIIALSGGNLMTIYRDSIIEISPTGSIINRYSNPVSGTLLDVFESSGSNIILVSTSGVFNFTLPATQNWAYTSNVRISAYNGNNIYINTNDSVICINSLNGSRIWGRYLSVSDASALAANSNGDLFLSQGLRPKHTSNSPRGPARPGFLHKLNNNGTSAWTKIYSVPYFGLSSIGILSGDKLLTGGTFLNCSGFALTTGDKFHSAFISLLDSSGSGALQQTTYFYPGDVNGNGLADGIADAAYAMVALNTLDHGRDIRIQPVENYSAIGQSWGRYFPNGINFQSADLDGNGLVDTNDVKIILNRSQFWDFSTCNFTSPQSIPAIRGNFHLVADRPVVLAGDTIRYYVLAGDSIPVDSLLGMGFTFNIPAQDAVISGDTIIYMNSVLGQPGVDLFTYTSKLQQHAYDLYFFVYRNDGQNRYLINDTLGYFDLAISDTLSQMAPLEFTNFNLLGLSASGYPVTSSVQVDSVIISPRLSGLHWTEQESVLLYPNPASGQLKILTTAAKPYRLTLFSGMGDVLLSRDLYAQHEVVDLSDLSPGIYFAELKFHSSILKRKICLVR